MLLALIAANATTNSRTIINLAHNLLTSAQAEAMADAAVHLAILALLDPDGNKLVPEDGTPFEISINAGTAILSVQDEAGMLNLNHASTEELRTLMEAVGIGAVQAAGLADAIVEFRSPGGGRRVAEVAPENVVGFQNLVGAKNGFFEVLEELQQVSGMTPALYRRIAPFVSADSRPSRIDPSVAPREVLLTLPGLNSADLDGIIAEHSPSTREFPIEDDDEIRGKGLPQERQLRQAPQRQVSTLRDLIAPSQRELFTIRAQATTPGGALFVREATIYCSRDPELPFRILGWRTGRPFMPDPAQSHSTSTP
jgi:type II secretory pathway component PulK